MKSQNPSKKKARPKLSDLGSSFPEFQILIPQIVRSEKLLRLLKKALRHRLIRVAADLGKLF